jgi:hypothetical protein
VLYIPTNGFGGGSGSGYSSVSAFATNAYFATNAGVVVGIQSNSIVTLTSHAVNQTNINNAVASSLSTLTNRPYVATVNGQTGNVTIVASLPAGAIVATNTPAAGQSFFGSSGTKDGVITGYFATASGSGDMLKSEYDAGGVKQVAFTNDPRIVLALTNAAAFATAAQGAKADTALQPANTSGWVVASHTYLESGLSMLTSTVNAVANTTATHTAQLSTQEVFRVASTVNYATNAGNAATVNGLTPTQILATASNSFALRAWVAGFSNAPASWNADFNTIDITNPDGTVLQVGQEQVTVVRNDNSYTITNGKACRAALASPGFYSSVQLASATDTLDQVMSTIGLATMDIPPGQIGKITTLGNVNNIPTLSFIEGSNLWMSATKGEIEMGMPSCTSDRRIVYIGQCLRSHANEGRIRVAVSHVPRAADICAETNGTAAAAAAGVSNALAPRIVALEGHAVAQTNINAGVASGLSTLTGAVDAASSTTATHTAQIAALSGTQAVVTASLTNYLPLSGGTLTGSVYTAVTNSPADNELARAGWVRGLLPSGAQWYFTQTPTNGFGEKTANFVALSRELPADAFTNVIASPVPSDTYIAGGVITGTVTSLQSPITLDVWAARVGGTAVSTIPLFAEIYYIYEGTINHLGDWSVGPWVVPSTEPQNHKFVVSFNVPAITNAVRIIAYLKTGTVTGPAAGMWIYGGDGYSSHMDINGTEGVLAGDVDAKLTTHTNRTDNPHAVTAAQVGAVPTNDVRYLAALTNAAAFDPAGTANSVSNVLASPYQPWTDTLTPPASGGTTLVTFANGTLPLLVCTGACTVGVSPEGGWGASGVNRFTLGLYIGSFSVTIATNGTPAGCNVRWGNTLSLSTTLTNQLLFRSVGTNDWVIYGSL